MIAIVDYGLGNLGSIRNMLKKAGFDSEIVSSPAEIVSAEKLIIPGVGAFNTAMQSLNALGFVDALNEAVLIRQVPVLGICLGMQLMTKRSAEGISPGLGWIDAETIKFSFPQGAGLKVPHMGWNVVNAMKPSPLLRNTEAEQRFYFVHSFYVKCANEENELLSAHHGHAFVAAFEQNNVMGVQFHPEKSHKFGMNLLKNFAEQY